MKNKVATFVFIVLASFTAGLTLVNNSKAQTPPPNNTAQPPGGTTATATSTTCSGENVFLTIPAWYRGLAEENGDNCDIKSPDKIESDRMKGLPAFITIVALNVVDMMLNVVVYVAVGFIMYGGFQYMLAQGSAQYIVSAKKTILNAVIGLVIAIMAISVVRFITGMFS